MHSSVQPADGSVRSDASAETGTLITPVKLRHPWRNVFAVVLILIVVFVIIDASQRKAFDWPAFGKYIFDERISQAALVTLELTVLAMIGAIILGLLLAIMRLSPNPVLKAVSWTYVWIFRGTPLYVQLVLWGLLATIYQQISFGIPFREPWVSFSTSQVLSAFWLAVLGLALNEASYLSEIMRAGIISVHRGQNEAATALGLSWSQTMRWVVLPQAMRIIIPPTGNEVIGMLKATSLVTAVPFSLDLFAKAQAISVETFNPVPLLLVACAWYLAITSVLMVGQHYLEKRFNRGTTHSGQALASGK